MEGRYAAVLLVRYVSYLTKARRAVCPVRYVSYLTKARRALFTNKVRFLPY